MRQRNTPSTDITQAEAVSAAARARGVEIEYWEEHAGITERGVFWAGMMRAAKHLKVDWREHGIAILRELCQRRRIAEQRGEEHVHQW